MNRITQAISRIIVSTLLILIATPVTNAHAELAYEGSHFHDDEDDHSNELQSEEEVLAHQALIDAEFPDQNLPVTLSSLEEDEILGSYGKLDPKGLIPKDLLATTLKYFESNRAKFNNQRYITIVDFAKHSARSRLFILDLNSGAVSVYHTTHGVGSDPKDTGVAQTFGNIVNSGMSSIGFFRTGETYHGNYGYSIRIDGLSRTNSRVRERAVVFHGWKKAKEKNVKQERSHGCFAFDFAVRDAIINKIKGGSLIYANVSGR